MGVVAGSELSGVCVGSGDGDGVDGGTASPMAALAILVHASPEKPAPGLAAGVNLSKLRQGWSQRFNEISSLPTEQRPRSETPTAPTIDDLPELPSLGAVASQAAMSMDDLDNYLADFHATEPHSPDLKPSSPAETKTENPAQSTVAVPEMPTSSPVSKPAPKSPHEQLQDLPAFPTPAAPNVSMPLVRDSLVEQASDDAPAAPAAPAAPSIEPDLSDLRKTAPQFSKLSPPPEGEAEHAPSKPADSPNPETPKAKVVSQDSEFTDEDLRDALQPIIDPVVDQFLYKPSQGIHTFLEPMLRSTVRRAIAEQMGEVSPFDEPSGWDKFAWKLRAVFSGRTYDDVVFDCTRRYQVEEVYLLRPHSRSLISYASQDPARHAKPEKVQGTVKKIASKESEHKDTETPWIKWPDNRNLMIRRGEHCILAAIVHGPSNAILRADLDYALRQAEERFGKALEEESDIHIQILQPLLEGCLLIQAPSIPN